VDGTLFAVVQYPNYGFSRLEIGWRSRFRTNSTIADISFPRNATALRIASGEHIGGPLYKLGKSIEARE
jgi:hypothetical protein